VIGIKSIHELWVVLQTHLFHFDPFFEWLVRIIFEDDWAFEIRYAGFVMFDWRRLSFGAYGVLLRYLIGGPVALRRFRVVVEFGGSLSARRFILHVRLGRLSIGVDLAHVVEFLQDGSIVSVFIPNRIDLQDGSFLGCTGRTVEVVGAGESGLGGVLLRHLRMKERFGIHKYKLRLFDDDK